MPIFAAVDVELAESKRIREVGYVGELFYVRFILLCKKMRTDGELTNGLLDIVGVGIPGKPKSHASRLLAAGLIEKTETGFRIPPDKWAEWQWTNAEIEDEKRQRAERKKRWLDKKKEQERDRERVPDINKPDDGTRSGTQPDTQQERTPTDLHTSIPFRPSDQSVFLSCDDQSSPMEEKPPPEIESTPTRRPRKRDPVVDALAVVHGIDPAKIGRSSGSMLGAAAADIREQTDGVTPDEIQRRAANLALHFPNAPVTAPSLAKHWGRCGAPPPGRNSRPLSSAEAPAGKYERFEMDSEPSAEAAPADPPRR